MMELYSTFIVHPEQEAAFLPLLPTDYKARKNTFLLGAATKEGVACGVIWAERIGIQVQLLHIETALSYRRKGVANQMLEDLYTAACKTRPPMTITASYVLTPQTMPLHQLLQQRREILLSVEEHIFMITSAARKSSLTFKQFCGRNSNAELFWDLDLEERQLFLCQLDPADRNFLEQIPAENFCKDLCFSCGSPARSAIFFTRTGEKELELSFLYVKSGKAEDLQKLLFAACKKINETHSSETVYIYTSDPGLKNLIQKLFPYFKLYRNRIRADWTYHIDTEGGEEA